MIWVYSAWIDSRFRSLIVLEADCTASSRMRINMALIFSQNMALVLEYSYVDNPSRDHASLANDFYGEHQFFFGMDVSFGSGYRR